MKIQLMDIQQFTDLKASGKLQLSKFRAKFRAATAHGDINL
jgi:hypothetical protein